MARRTKIVATVGPSCDEPAQLEALIRAGADVCRIGLAHGDVDVHLQRIANVRAAADAAGKHVPVLVDLPGPKVRAATFPQGGVFLREGQVVDLAVGTESSNWDRIEVEYETLLEDLEPGDTVALGDGLISLEVAERDGDLLRARVVAGGRAQGRPGVHLPAEKLRLSTPTSQDLALLERLAPARPEIVAISFVRGPEDVEQVRAAVGDPRTMLMAKIETRAAVEQLEPILDVSDAVMVARGDLGIECPPEEVPHLQKRIIRTCVEWGTPVVTATQMLESMVHSPIPTRAEASDVANAVLDGTDAVMLSGETAIGHDPTLAVSTMARIVQRAEQAADYVAWGARLGKMQRLSGSPRHQEIAAAVAHAAWQIVVELDADAVIACTRSGLTARAMARFRPPCPIVAFSPVPSTVRQLAVSWGVTPRPIPWSASTDDMVWLAVERAVHEGFCKAGDTIVVVAGAAAQHEHAEEQSSDVLRVVRVR